MTNPLRSLSTLITCCYTTPPLIWCRAASPVTSPFAFSFAFHTLLILSLYSSRCAFLSPLTQDPRQCNIRASPRTPPLHPPLHSFVFDMMKVDSRWDFTPLPPFFTLRPRPPVRGRQVFIPVSQGHEGMELAVHAQDVRPLGVASRSVCVPLVGPVHCALL